LNKLPTQNGSNLISFSKFTFIKRLYQFFIIMVLHNKDGNKMAATAKTISQSQGMHINLSVLKNFIVNY